MNATKHIVERRAIDFVPESERHGSVKSMFTLFFSVNMQITAVAIGIIPFELGLSLWWSLAAILAGNLLGGVVMALHAVQGPKIGMPQMIQSRAQFGVLGANLPLVLVVIMYLGFFAGTTMLGAQVFEEVLGLAQGPSIVLTNLLCLGLFALGHDAIHRFAKWATVAFSIMFVFATIYAINGVVEQSVTTSAGGFSLASFLIVVAICVGWQITFGPYVADYSRYLPKKTGSTRIFIWTYAGSVIGTCWSMGVGLLLGFVAGAAASSHTTAAFAGLFGAGAMVHGLVLVLVLAGAIVINAVNLYGGSLSFLSIMGSSKRLAATTLEHGKRWRLVVGVGGALLGSWISVAGAGSIMAYLQNLMILLGYVFIPWSAVNLTDFFLVRHGHYSTKDIYRKSGIYGAFGWPALSAFVVAALAELPFISVPFYTGPIARALGGVDIAWLVGLLVGCGIYFLLAQQHSRAPACDAA